MSDKEKEIIEDQDIQNQTEETSTGEVVEVNELEELKTQLGEEKNKFLRLFAEFENYKKRTQKERVDLFKTANQEVLQALLPVCDDFERALENIQKIENIDQGVVEGVELIQNKLNSTLESKGLAKIEVGAGSDFDTDFHEAITQIPAPSEDLKGKIIDVVETGYTLNEKVIRFAKVVVGN
ncbi:protein GrpE [Flavobacteriaceae bacterium UJ101]|nr:protein GrpE [Flavobacteriaceae bacterium UJ101]